ncbi:RxLR effector protein [Phytophthora megakarya]|uniref:RxLR effector protein n=1 Tax=Phytophthora megakarya TaxID=4795 RepID=A0A225V4Y6_9STRA|nr:RxLR effector protein [Phytophthora megakarya]
MRVTFVLLAVIVIPTANAATNTVHSTLSTIKTTLDDHKSKQFLRTHKEPDDKGVDNTVEDDGEARVVLVKKTPFFWQLLMGDKHNTFKVTSDQLSNLLKGNTRDILVRWIQQGYSIENFQNTFSKLVQSRKITKEQYQDFVVWYRDVYRHNY